MPHLKAQTESILEKKKQALELGGAGEIEKQHQAGKLTVRERLDLLFDKGSFVELGLLARSESSDKELKDKPTPADGCVTGFGKVNGRTVSVIAYDFTVLAGSIGLVGERKAARIRELALKERIPIVWLLDSAGARIQEIAGSHFAQSGDMFYDQIQLSGAVPQVAAMMGPCAAGTAYIPALADFVPMVKGTSSMALAGPPLVKAAIGEDVSVEDLGGSKIHCEVSGVGDLEATDDKACIQAIKDFLSYFPQNSDDPPASLPHSAVERIDDSILEVLPDDSRKPYDMKKVLEKIADNGVFFEIKPQYAKSVITALMRVGGRSVGVIANQPNYMGGVLDVNSADKSARFINLCDAFNIPLLFLQDVPGFMVGSKVEKEGIIRHGAKMLYAVSRATVPKITIVIRKGYGAGYYVMCGKGFEPDLIVAWPSAEISLMGPEGAVNIIFRKEIESSPLPDVTRGKLVEEFSKRISIDIAAGGAYIDDVIDPRDTRKIIAQTLDL
ncbi:MAG: acyl-CoA carboxylase subunit beta, partial [bacterium]